MEYYSLQGCKKIGNKISFWVFPGGRSGFSFSLYPKTLAILSVLLITAVVTSMYVGVKMTSHWLTYDEQESVRLLQAYLQKKAAAAAQDGNAKVASLEDKELDAKIQLLVDEFIRVRDYERNLRNKASALDAVLQDALQLNEDSFTGKPASQNQDRASLSSWDNGVGGAEPPITPVIVGLYPVVAKRVFKEDPRTLIEKIETQTELLNGIPVGLPVIDAGRITSGFGPRRSPFSRGWRRHTGIDYAAPRWTHVLATAEGLVVQAGWKHGLGRVVTIKHQSGIETMYAHLSRIKVKVGDKICRGQQLGNVGSSGRSTGPHLHYEVHVGGVPTDPEPFIELARTLKYLNS